MINVNRYYKTVVNGSVNYLLAPGQAQFLNSNVNQVVTANYNNVILARYVGYSSTEERDVYEVECVGGVKVLTDYDGADNILNGSISEYVKYVTEDGRRVSVNTDYDFFANPFQVVNVVPAKQGYNNSTDADLDQNNVDCYKVTMSNGSSFITNNNGRTSLDANWC